MYGISGSFCLVHPNIIAKATPAIPRKGANLGVKSSPTLSAIAKEIVDMEARSPNRIVFGLMEGDLLARYGIESVFTVQMVMPDV